jgi:O-antigen/teichoic acid export membrane protein
VALSATVPLCLLVGIGRGVLQGEERFVPLSLNFITYGVTTLAFLPILLHFHLRAVGAVVAINLALVLCNLFATIMLRDLPHAAHHARLHIGRILRSSLGASAGIAVITLFYNFDVLLAKHFLTGSDPGLYSAMSLLGKILFFGTISISAVMFPRIATMHTEGKNPHPVVNLSLGLVLLVGGVVTLIYFFLPKLTVHLLFHKDEDALAPLIGIYALAMLGLALANVLVYYFVAVHRRRFVWGVLFGGAAFVVLLWLFHSTLREFTVSVTVAIDAMALVLVGMYLFERPHLTRHPDEETPPLEPVAAI